MLKAWLFLKNGGHRSQQTERIVNNFLKWFVTEPRSYIKEGESEDNGCDFG